MKIKDSISGLSHLFAALLAGLGVVVLVYLAAGKPWHVVGFAIYGASLVLLYTASALYHLIPLSPAGTVVLRKFDHIAIYILIAGTYTPVCLVTLRGAWGWSLLGTIWGLALIGTVFKLFYLRAPRWLSPVLYVAMGWMAIIAFVPLVRAFPAAAIGWLLFGGALYTLGALIYAAKHPNLGLFGFHEIFHLLVMGGSICHYVLMLRYVLPQG